jgi:hypothetical protein
VPVVLMMCYARSGGTLLNRCLGSLPNTVVVSEVSPIAGGGSTRYPRTVQEQAKAWYDIELAHADFTTSVCELNDVCARSNRRLIVREWTYAAYAACEANENTPPYKLVSLEALSAKCSVVSFAFIRDAVDVWISLGAPNIDEFSGQYLRYAESLVRSRIRTFKYEGLCLDPDVMMAEICSHCGLEFSRSFREQRPDGAKGDPEDSRGQRGGGIRLLPRRRITPAKVRELHQCQAIAEANGLLGYSTSYETAKAESFTQKWWDRADWVLHRLGRAIRRVVLGRGRR